MIEAVPCPGVPQLRVTAVVTVTLHGGRIERGGWVSFPSLGTVARA